MEHYNTSLLCNNSVPLVYTLFAEKLDRNCDKSDSRKSWLTYRGFFINGFDDKFLIIERNVPDLTPGEANFRCHPEKRGEEGSQIFFILLTVINVTFHNYSTVCQKQFLFVCFFGSFKKKKKKSQAHEGKLNIIWLIFAKHAHGSKIWEISNTTDFKTLICVIL